MEALSVSKGLTLTGACVGKRTLCEIFSRAAHCVYKYLSKAHCVQDRMLGKVHCVQNRMLGKVHNA